jgi:hypothetical protein
MTAPRLIVLASLLFSTAASTADYFVRTDGADANPGTGNTAGEAFRTIGKCAGLAKAGDRCLVQPGTYRETGATQANPGAQIGTAVNTCTCTRGSQTVNCTAALSATVAPGTFVRCSGAHGFGWTRVASATGTSITLDEPYLGKTLAGAPLDVAKFVEIVGRGTSPREVTMTEFAVRSVPVQWQKVPGFSCVWKYDHTSAVDPAWKIPTGFREDVPDTSWNLFGEQKNGRDVYYRLWATGSAPPNTLGDCPCRVAGGVPAQVDTVPGSWGDDGTFIYLQTRGCQDPDTAKVLAGRHGTSGEYGNTLQSAQPFSLVKNITADVAGFDYAYNSAWAYGFVLGASNARYSGLRQEGGRMHFFPPQDSVDTLYEHLQTLEGSKCTISTGHSGLALYDVEIRGGFPGGLSCDAIRGAGADDPIRFDRVYEHRTYMALYGDPSCNGGTTWDCANHTFKSCPSCENQDPRAFACHGVYISDAAIDNNCDHIVVQNSVVEMAADGWGIFHGQGGSDVWFINNTFGISHHLDDGVKAMIGTAGANGNWGAHLFNNLFVLARAAEGGIHYEGAKGTIESDYNLFMPFSQVGNARVWNQTETLDYVIANYGQEAHSAIVCQSGCAGAHGTYFNDNGESGLADTSVFDGTPADYTPTPSFRGLDKGSNTYCPAEDFYGHPRSDGKCDIGAVERQGGPAQADAGASAGPDAAPLFSDASQSDIGGLPAADAQPPVADASQASADSAVPPGDAAGGDAAASPADATGRGDGSLLPDATVAGHPDARTLADSGASSPVSRGCGCGAAGGAASWIALAAGLALRPRRKQISHP